MDLINIFISSGIKWMYQQRRAVDTQPFAANIFSQPVGSRDIKHSDTAALFII